jgi:Uri superfamily endonuclease
VNPVANIIEIAPRVKRENPGTYQLTLRVARAVRVRIGRLGEFSFPAGRYVYTGSARRNLEARIARHLRRDKAMHWHIDWLLSAPGVEVVGVRRSRLAECVLNRCAGGRVLVAGFGASDCRMGCGSHLRYLGDESQSRRTAAGPAGTAQPSRSSIDSSKRMTPAMASATPTDRATEKKASRRPRTRSMTAKVETQGT